MAVPTTGPAQNETRTRNRQPIVGWLETFPSMSARGASSSVCLWPGLSVGGTASRASAAPCLLFRLMLSFLFSFQILNFYLYSWTSKSHPSFNYFTMCVGDRVNAASACGAEVRFWCPAGKYLPRPTLEVAPSAPVRPDPRLLL